ncbi:hypothetical protein [Pseudophaeobacter sp. EL27]|uniref:hypothetical protein n=1 Tax=Pseudophaeobacter sp. EL27 TaxID=2107580 RepID=UPI000EFB04ED|nr:hypothetical protein [Pseudophaeobacter sp. EL27]
MPVLSLKPCATSTEPPVGVIIGDLETSGVWNRLPRYGQLKLAVLTGRLVLFGQEKKPDLPWVDGATYLRDLGQRVYCPVQFEVNSPPSIWPDMAEKLRRQSGATDTILLEQGQTLTLSDLGNAQLCNDIDLGAVQAQALKALL